MSGCRPRSPRTRPGAVRTSFLLAAAGPLRPCPSWRRSRWPPPPGICRTRRRRHWPPHSPARRRLSGNKLTASVGRTRTSSGSSKRGPSTTRLGLQHPLTAGGSGSPPSSRPRSALWTRTATGASLAATCCRRRAPSRPRCRRGLWRPPRMRPCMPMWMRCRWRRCCWPQGPPPRPWRARSGGNAARRGSCWASREARWRGIAATPMSPRPTLRALPPHPSRVAPARRGARSPTRPTAAPGARRNRMRWASGEAACGIDASARPPGSRRL
mmetsp:Transcript_11418/g.32674  ORF Transcript_11418/g.32674 Transcript_11418/m.32674 type:complete len:270 (-) Transcript_11418:174-983(-)